MGVNHSNIRITKRNKLEKPENAKYRSPQNRTHKNASKMEKDSKFEINKSFKICKDHLPELNLKQAKMKSKRNMKLQLNDSSVKNLCSMTDAQIEYCSTDKGNTSYNKENKDRFRFLYSEKTDFLDTKNITNFKNKLLS